MAGYRKRYGGRVTKKAGGRRKLTSKNLVTGPALRAARRHFSPMMATAATLGTLGVSRYVQNKFGKRSKKRTSGTSSSVLTKRKDNGTGGYNQWTQRYEQATLGRLTARKINSMALDKIILTHQRIGPFNDAGQAYMSNNLDVAGNKYYPLFLFELNSVNNFINGSLNTAYPVYQLYQVAGTNRMALNALNGQGSDGVLGPTGWVFEKGSHTLATGASYPMENAIHAWSSLDLECWGCTQKPTKFNIMLCQFNEDVLFPDTFVGTNHYYDIMPTTNAQGSEFWQSLVKHYSYSPLAKIDDGFNRKKIKILKQYAFNIDPTSNFENDPDPHVKTMKLFYRFNRKCNFQWKFANGAGQTIAEMNDADWQQEDGENQCRPHPNARLFVMVRAANYTPLAATPTNSVSTPSISWKMRTCYMINQ